MTYFPAAWIFFVPFIIVTSFAVLNLFIGIIVDAMQTVQQNNKQEHDPLTENPSTPTTEQLNAKVDELTIAVRDLNNLIRAKSPDR